MTPKREKPPKSAADRARSVERHAGEGHFAPSPLRDGGPEVPDDSPEKQKASPRRNPARRRQILPG